jgi:hypothetical protein
MDENSSLNKVDANRNERVKLLTVTHDDFVAKHWADDFAQDSSGLHTQRRGD